VTTPKRTSKEVLLSLHEQADHDEALDHVLSASEEELEEELRAAGFDLDRIDHEPLGSKPVAGVESAPAKQARAVAAVIPLPASGAKRARGTIRRAWWVVLPAAAAAVAIVTAATVAGVAYFQRDRRILPDPGTQPLRTSDERMADGLRRDAEQACAAADWDGCGRKLDEARALDPAGESAAGVAAAREAIGRNRVVVQQSEEAGRIESADSGRRSAEDAGRRDPRPPPPPAARVDAGKGPLGGGEK